MNRSDTELVTAARAGDRAALGDIYERYADRIYSFCLSRLRDPADAADCSQDTFVRAATRLEQLRDPSRLRAWLFAIARNTIVDRARDRARNAPDEGLADMASNATGPEDVAGRTAAAELIWAAADALQERDQDLLRLQLQQGLAGNDLADVMGVSRNHLDVMQNRLRERMSKAAGALLVARHGRDDCAELQALLAGWDGSFILEVRSQVTRHISSCDVCERRRSVLTAPGNYLGAVPLIAAPVLLRARTVAAMEGAVQLPAAPTTRRRRRERDADDAWDWRDDGFPEPRDLRPRSRVALATMAVAATIAIIAGTVALASQFRDDRVLVEVTAAAPTSEPAAAPAPSATPLPTATPEPATPGPTAAVEPAPTEAPVVSPPVPAPPVPATPVPPTPVPPTPIPATPVPPTPTPTPPTPPTIVRSAVSPSTVMTDSEACSLTTSQASVVVDDTAAISTATAAWTPPGGSLQTAAMTDAGNGAYVSTVGPFAEPGTATITMTAVNEFGGSAAATVSLTIVPCVG